MTAATGPWKWVSDAETRTTAAGSVAPVIAAELHGHSVVIALHETLYLTVELVLEDPCAYRVGADQVKQRLGGGDHLAILIGPARTEFGAQRLLPRLRLLLVLGERDLTSLVAVQPLAQQILESRIRIFDRLACAFLDSSKRPGSQGAQYQGKRSHRSLPIRPPTAS